MKTGIPRGSSTQRISRPSSFSMRHVERALHSRPAREMRPGDIAALRVDAIADVQVQRIVLVLHGLDRLDQLLQIQQAHVSQLVVAELLVHVDQALAARNSG